MTTSSEQRVAPITDGRTDLVTMLLATWLMIGLFLDGYAHTNLIDELESFFTPWHGIFYSGFLATSAWVGWIIYKNVIDGIPVREAIPAGYGPTVVGLLIFAIGGIGDGIWHTLFGVEAGIDALLSPTHFILFGGGVLGLSTVVRTSRIRSPGQSIARSDLAPLVVSLTLVTGAIAFFSAYMWIPGQPWVLEQPLDVSTGAGQGAIAFGIAGLLVSTTILLSPALIVLRWWRPPIGLFTIIWVVINTGIALSFSMHLGVAVLFGVVGGVVGDLAGWMLRPGPANRGRSLVVLGLVPMAAWSAYMAGSAGVGLLHWQPELWVGAIVLSGLAGLGLGWIVLPDAERGPLPTD